MPVESSIDALSCVDELELVSDVVYGGLPVGGIVESSLYVGDIGSFLLTLVGRVYPPGVVDGVALSPQVVGLFSTQWPGILQVDGGSWRPYGYVVVDSIELMYRDLPEFLDRRFKGISGVGFRGNDLLDDLGIRNEFGGNLLFFLGCLTLVALVRAYGGHVTGAVLVLPFLVFLGYRLQTCLLYTSPSPRDS